jgi:hypothetical protein
MEQVPNILNCLSSFFPEIQVHANF